MAGGPLAQEIVCYECLSDGTLTKATRIYEGVEDDHYECAEGHQFGVDYRNGPSTKAEWPPDPELVEALTQKN